MQDKDLKSVQCEPVKEGPVPMGAAASAQEKNEVVPPSGSGRYLLLACWFAVVAGFWELGFLAFRVFVQRQIIVGSANPHLPWLTFVAQLLVFGPVGLVFFFLDRHWPRFVSLRVAAFLLALLLVFNLRALFSETPWYAWLTLNVGAALGFAQLLGFFPSAGIAFVRRNLFVLVPAAVAVCLGIYLRDAVTESRAVAGLAPANPQAPNVLLLVLDTVRAQSMSVYGYQHETTPRLKEWAGHGVCFERAIAPSSWTLPSHASFFTGHMPHEMFQDWPRMKEDPWQLGMDDRFPTLAEVLTKYGYQTAGFVANWTYGDRVYGLHRGFIHYEDRMAFTNARLWLEEVVNSSYLTRIAANEIFKKRDIESREPQSDVSTPAQKNQILLQKTNIQLARKDAHEINKEFLAWLNKNHERPFFAFLNYMDVHAPYKRHTEFADRLASTIEGGLPEPVADTQMAEGLLSARFDYETSLAFLDAQIGSLLDELQDRDVLKRTLVIVTSDHGDQFGEHDLEDHGNSLYMQLLHVPLIILLPGRVPAAVRVPEAVSLVNLAATVMDVIDLKGNVKMPGKSLAGFWTGTPASSHPEPVYSELDHVVQIPKPRSILRRSVVSDGYHYIFNRSENHEELFHWQSDPYEEHNLIGTKDKKAVVNKLSALIKQRPDVEQYDP